MSEREGLYCEKHERWCPDGVCDYCAPAADPGERWLVALELRACSPEDHIWIDDSLLCVCGAKRLPERYGGVPKARPCDHATGYCKDTAHKYELPTETIPETPTQKKTRAALIGCGLAALADWHWTPVE